MFQRCDDDGLNLRAGLGDGPSDDARLTGPSEEEYCRGLFEAGFVFDGISAPAHCAAYFPSYRGMVPEIYPGEIMTQAPTVSTGSIVGNLIERVRAESVAEKAPAAVDIQNAPRDFVGPVFVPDFVGPKFTPLPPAAVAPLAPGAIAPYFPPAPPPEPLRTVAPPGAIVVSAPTAPVPSPVVSTMPAPAPAAAPAPPPVAGGGSSGGGMPGGGVSVPPSNLVNAQIVGERLDESTGEWSPIWRGVNAAGEVVEQVAQARRGGGGGILSLALLALPFVLR